MNRPSCCWMIGWYAERPCRSCEPTSAISRASGTLPGAGGATTCAPPQSSRKKVHTRHSMTLLNHCGIFTLLCYGDYVYMVARQEGSPCEAECGNAIP